MNIYKFLTENEVCLISKLKDSIEIGGSYTAKM